MVDGGLGIPSSQLFTMSTLFGQAYPCALTGCSHRSSTRKTNLVNETGSAFNPAHDCDRFTAELVPVRKALADGDGLFFLGPPDWNERPFRYLPDLEHDLTDINITLVGSHAQRHSARKKSGRVES